MNRGFAATKANRSLRSLLIAAAPLLKCSASVWASPRAKVLRRPKGAVSFSRPEGRLALVMIVNCQLVRVCEVHEVGGDECGGLGAQSAASEAHAPEAQ